MSSPVVPAPVLELLERFGEALVVPLVDALLRRDLSAAERRARAIVETEGGIEALEALARKVGHEP